MSDSVALPQPERLAMATLTTIGVGGPASVVTVRDTETFVQVAQQLWHTGEDWLLLGGGSNLVVSDEGFSGTVILVETLGIERLLESSSGPGSVRLRVAAGETWDDLVEYTVAQGWGGLESLSGIPGKAGAAPMQNIGAYGYEIASVLREVEFLDYLTGERLTLGVDELELGYRSSVFKNGREGAVLSLVIELHDGGLSLPVHYQQLADQLGCVLGDRMPVTEVRSAVLALRGAKGMVYNPSDVDSVSCGSFFTNPIVQHSFALSLPLDAPRWQIGDLPPRMGSLRASGEHPPLVKLSAAWLIERAGITRGFGLPGSRAAVSGKHTLAITNRGGATATEVLQLASFIQQRVLNEFGVKLHPEPTLIGVDF